MDWDQERFDEVVGEVSKFLVKVGFKLADVTFVPVSGFRGDNLVPAKDSARGSKVPDQGAWYYDESRYAGISLVEAINKLPPPEQDLNAPLRLTIADTYVEPANHDCVIVNHTSQL